jgi:hypothetical protein
MKIKKTKVLHNNEDFKIPTSSNLNYSKYH